jgi:hypothetical protein
MQHWAPGTAFRSTIEEELEMRKSLFFLVFALFVTGSGFASQGEIVEVAGLRPTAEFDRAAYLEEQQRLLSWLVESEVEAGFTSPIAIKLTNQELTEIERGYCEGCQAAAEGLLAGMVKPVDVSFDLDRQTHGASTTLADGTLIWTAAIHSDQAAALRVHFSDFSLPDGFEVWLYSTAGDVRGPYTGRGPNGSGEFWSHTISGPTAALQLRGVDSLSQEQPAAFAITDLGHVGDGTAVKSFCSFNADCVENGECSNVSAVSDAKNAVAHMQYVKRPYIYFCSGGLLNDTNNSGTPYFLTANHCISRDREAGTLEAFFQFTIPCGSTACPDYNQINAPTTLGSTVLATNSTSDFTLLELHQTPPSGSVFMGWTNAEVVGTGADIFRISHPGGAPQAYSKHTEWVPPVVCNGWPRGEWIYTQDQIGATEGGSSGSPVVNASGQVVGQLSGGCGYNVNDNCDNINNSTVDGALAAYFDQVAPWLAPGGGCTDNDGDGSCADVDCDDNDPFNFPGNTENCSDGQDNDCNGLIDSADPACGSSCLPTGAACTSNDECCSLRCHPRRLTCK